MGKRELNVIRLNNPYPSTRKDKKLMVYVRNPKTKRINIIHFGQKNSSIKGRKKEREKYLKRSAGIKDKTGKLTKNNPMRANYWTRKVIWRKRK